MKKLWFLFLFVFSFCLFANEEMEVALGTNNPLIPIYLSPLICKEAEWKAGYIEALDQIMRFDFHRSGYFFVLPRNGQKDRLFFHPDNISTFNQDLWKQTKAGYVMRMQIKQKILYMEVFNVKEKKVMPIAEVFLLGEMKHDRRKIHQVFEKTLMRLLGKRGITSGSILYTIRIPKKGDDNKEEKQWLSEVWICDYDGANCRQLTFENQYCVHPLSFSKIHPDNFLYVSYKLGQPKIYLYDTQKNFSSSFVQLRGNQLLPALSASFDKLAFISDAAGRADLFLQYLDNRGHCKGKPIQLFSYPRATQASPVFSPDGEKLAFVSDKDGTPRIYVLQIPRNFQRLKRPFAQLLTKKNRHNVTPAWSPDGTKLAYSAMAQGVRQIWIYDFLTDEETQLTKGPYHKENPVWAGDDIHLIYNSDHPESAELFLIDLHLRQPIQITTGFGKKRFPSWKPFGIVE